MSDDAIKAPLGSSPRSRTFRSPTASPARSARRRYAIYALGALIVVLTLAYIDGGQEPLHPIVQTVSLPSQAEVQP